MKTHKIKFLTLFIAAMAFFATGCQEDFVDSRPTFLPDIALIGSSQVVIIAGDEYDEAGASASVNGTPIDYSISGEVDVNTPGIYILDYLATNDDGFSSSVSRTVFVLPGEPDPAAPDISGNYRRSTNNRASTVTKVTDGVYFMSDGWGSATSNGNPLPVPCYLFSLNGVDVTMPEYPTVFGAMVGTGTFDGSKLVIQTTLLDQGPFSRVNTWIKQ